MYEIEKLNIKGEKSKKAFKLIIELLEANEQKAFRALYERCKKIPCNTNTVTRVVNILLKENVIIEVTKRQYRLTTKKIKPEPNANPLDSLAKDSVLQKTPLAMY